MKKKRDFTGVWMLLLKGVMYLFACAAFFIAMSFENPQILRFSRTSGVTLLTFFAMGAVLVSIYGGYNVGGQKPRPIVVSIILAIWITDCITYLQLQIMNVNGANYEHITLFGPAFVHLLIAMLIQLVLVYVFVYGGTRLFFHLNEPQRCVIISTTGADETRMRSKIERYRLQFRVVDVVDYRDACLEQVLDENDTFFFGVVPIAERLALMERCYAKRKSLYYHMDVPDVIEFCAHHVILDDIPFMQVSAQELTMDQRIIKRTMDLIVSIAALLLLSPVMLVCALAIKLCDGGRVFYRQNRATRDGEIFRIFKFRTMFEHDECTPNHSVTNGDERITPVGRVLRKCRLDELPQLFNIVLGDMSLVGPRPEMLENVEQYTREMPAFAYRLKVKAGLTGYAQIEGKYNTTPRDKMIMDIMYIEQYSLWLDIKLLMRTFTVFFKKDSTEAFDASPKPPEEKTHEESA